MRLISLLNTIYIYVGKTRDDIEQHLKYVESDANFAVCDRKPNDPLYLVRIVSSCHSFIFHFFVFYQLGGQIETVIHNFSGESLLLFERYIAIVYDFRSNDQYSPSQ